MLPFFEHNILSIAGVVRFKLKSKVDHLTFSHNFFRSRILMLFFLHFTTNLPWETLKATSVINNREGGRFLNLEGQAIMQYFLIEQALFVILPMFGEGRGGQLPPCPSGSAGPKQGDIRNKQG